MVSLQPHYVSNIENLNACLLLWYGGGCGTEAVLWNGGGTMAWGRLWLSEGCGMLWRLWHGGGCITAATVAGRHRVGKNSSGLLQLFLLGQFSLLGQNISKVLALLIMLRQFSYWGKNQ